MLDLLAIKIDERFHNMADAYMYFDLDFDNKVNFAEFQDRLDNLRVNFDIPQIKILFEALDHGNKGFICFKDFCELGEEKRRGIDAYENYLKEIKEKEKQKKFQTVNPSPRNISPVKEFLKE